MLRTDTGKKEGHLQNGKKTKDVGRGKERKGKEIKNRIEGKKWTQKSGEVKEG